MNSGPPWGGPCFGDHSWRSRRLRFAGDRRGVSRLETPRGTERVAGARVNGGRTGGRRTGRQTGGNGWEWPPSADSLQLSRAACTIPPSPPPCTSAGPRTLPHTHRVQQGPPQRFSPPPRDSASAHRASTDALVARTGGQALAPGGRADPEPGAAHQPSGATPGPQARSARGHLPALLP